MTRKIEDYIFKHRRPKQIVSTEQQIEDIMAEVNFEKIHKTMVALDWKWSKDTMRVPTVDEIKEEGLYLLNRAAELEVDTELPVSYASCGGLYARKIVYHDVVLLELSFCVSGWDCDWDYVTGSSE